MKITGSLIGAAAGSLGLLGSAQAASVGFSLTNGANLTIDVLLTEVAGDIQFDIAVDPAGDLADLRGIFFDVADDALVSGLSVSGTDVTDFQFSANSVNDLGNGANMNGPGPDFYDAGVEIGDSGIGGGDDFNQTQFTISHTSVDLSLDDFFGQNFGIRATSVGPVGDREGSEKLTTVVIPTPAAAGMGLALLGLGALRRVRRDA